MDNNEIVEGKKRHGCLLVYLLLMLIANAFNSFVYLNPPTLPPEMAESANVIGWLFPVMAIVGLINLISTVAILKWKKWGFWLFTLTAFVPFCINLYSGMFAVYSLLSEFIVVAILYGVLQNRGRQKRMVSA